MPWKETDVMQQRVEFVAQALAGDVSFSRLCRRFGVERSTGYRWWKRFLETNSFQQLRELSRRPHRSPSRTDVFQEEAVVALRVKYGWGGKKLQELLKKEGIHLSVPTVNRILKRRGLVKAEDSHAKATRRFQMECPNELWQMDFKGEFPLKDGSCYPLSILDDCSRYLLGLYGLPGQQAHMVDECLVDVFERYGVPEGMLVDHGTPWWSTTNGYGLTWLSVKLIKQGIKLRLSGIGHPQTQGKVERFHRTLKAAARHKGGAEDIEGWRRLLGEFRRDYNEVRPHEALSMAAPIERYRRSSKEYESDPRDWEYPEGSAVKRLNSQGCLDYGGRRYFVCEALCRERVRVQEADGRLLVVYRHMYVREIDLMSGASKALIMPDQRP